MILICPNCRGEGWLDSNTGATACPNCSQPPSVAQTGGSGYLFDDGVPVPFGLALGWERLQWMN
jgi:uncharacterized protein YbaR (Trm112 family)